MAQGRAAALGVGPRLRWGLCLRMRLRGHRGSCQGARRRECTRIFDCLSYDLLTEQAGRGCARLQNQELDQLFDLLESSRWFVAELGPATIHRELV